MLHCTEPSMVAKSDWLILLTVFSLEKASVEAKWALTKPGFPWRRHSSSLRYLWLFYAIPQAQACTRENAAEI